MAAIVKTLPVHSEFDKLAAFMRERLAAREAREGPRSPLAKLFSFGKGSSRGGEAPEVGKLVVTKDDLEAFEHAHPEVCFAIWMYQPPVMRMCFVSRAFMLTGWHRIELEDGVDPTDEQRLEYYAIMNRMINRGCNDTLHAERTLYANAFRAGNSLLSGFVIESGVMEHRWTSVAWTGAIPPLPEHPDIAEFEGFDANAEDFRDTTVFYTTGGLLTTRQQQAVPSEGTASDGGQFKSLALRSLGCFRYNQHKMTMVRLCDGRVLNQNVASCNFYGVLTDRQDLNFLNEFIFNDFLDGRDKLKAQFMELVLKRRNTMKIRHRQCKDLVKNLGGSAVSSVLEDGNACPDGFVWHETLIVAGNDPMANVWDPDREVDSDDKFAQGVETPRVSGFTPDHLRQQHLPRERCAYILQSDITEIRKLQERVYKAHKKELERKKQQKAAMRELLYSMMPRPVAQELLHASRKEAAAMAGADSPHGMGGSSSGRSLAASDEPLSGFRKMAGRIAPRQHDTVTICFTDIKGYTSMSKAADPIQVMTFLDELFGKFDEIVDVINAEFGDIGILYKVETIGDAFMVAGGLNLCMDADHKVKEGGGSSSSSSSSDEEGGSNDLDELLGRSQSGEPKLKTVASTILRMKQEGWMEQQVVGNDPVPGEGRPAPRDNRAIDEGPPLAQATAEDAALAVTYFAEQAIRVASETIMPDGKPACIRAGIHSGQVVSGIVGKKMPRFCLFGDSVNTASRMESNGKPGHIHISEPTWKLLQGQENGYSWLPTGGVELKGKGVQPTWLSERAYQANCGC